MARNLIVHNGGEADQEAPDASKDQEFRNLYPDLVDHYDRVAVPEQSVREQVQAAVDFLRWIAPLLRSIELQRLGAEATLCADCGDFRVKNMRVPVESRALVNRNARPTT